MVRIGDHTIMSRHALSIYTAPVFKAWSRQTRPIYHQSDCCSTLRLYIYCTDT